MRATSEFTHILIPDSVFNSDNHRIPDNDGLLDDRREWFLLERIENLPIAIEILSKPHQNDVFIRVLIHPSLTPQQKKRCKEARINVIVLEREIKDTKPTERFFWNATLDTYNRDWYYEGYGSTDDAETVWWRRIDQVTRSEAISSETCDAERWKSQW